MQFEVLDAERSLEGALTHWVYKIRCTTGISSYQSPPLFPKVTGDPAQNFINNGDSHSFTSRHRYSDFEWLVEKLTKEYPGYILPPIPEKEVVGSVDKLGALFSKSIETESAATNSITSKRIRHIQLFLNYLAALTDLHETEYIKAFVTMEEREWERYKEDVKKRTAVTPSGFFGKVVMKVTSDKVVVFPPESKMGGIRAAHQDFATALALASKAATAVVEKSLCEATIVASVTELCQNQANKDVYLPTAYIDHQVMSPSTHGDRIGRIRHIEGTLVWVEFEAGSLVQLPYTSLRTPYSGLSDPILIAVDQLGSQCDNFLAYSHVNNTFKTVEAISDECWFWGKYCESVVKTIDRLSEVQNEYLYHQKDSDKTSDSKKKAAFLEKATAAQATFNNGCEKFNRDYEGTFRANYKEAMASICSRMGLESSRLLVDDQWTQRLEVADKVLSLDFDIPEPVKEDVQRILENRATEQPKFVSTAQQPTATIHAQKAADSPSNADAQDGPVVPAPRDFQDE